MTANDHDLSTTTRAAGDGRTLGGGRPARIVLTPRAFLLALLWVGAVAGVSGCCDLRQSTLRCGACCYDNCVIPLAAAPGSALQPALPAPSPRLAGAPREMAY